jgi:hypothetical protein
VRLLLEAFNNLDGPGGLIEKYAQDVHFYQDMWTYLFTPPPGTEWESYLLDGVVPIPLKTLFVGEPELALTAYYPVDSNNVPGPVAFIDLPPLTGLIDFHWQGSLPGVPVGSDLVAFTAEERTKLQTLMDLLSKWDNDATPPRDKFQNIASSVAAALLAEYHLGFKGKVYEAGPSRPWLPLFQGFLGADSAPNLTCPDVPAAQPLLANGDIPPLTDGRFDSGKYPLNYLAPYADFDALANPGDDTMASWLGHNVDTDKINQYPDNIPFDALYTDVASRTVRTTFDKNQINALIEFYFNLGGWDLNPAAGVINSRKLAVYAHPTFACGDGVVRADLAAAATRKGYPMTRNMVPIMMLRRLLEAAEFLENAYGSLPTYGEVFRTRAFDYDGTLRWPTPQQTATPEEGLPMEAGPGILRSVGCEADYRADIEKGFQEKVYCVAGSDRSIFTFFPEGQPNEPPKSFYWNPPGQNMARFDSIHWVDHMDAFRRNQPRPTHFRDYRSFQSPEYPAVVNYVYEP